MADNVLVTCYLYQGGKTYEQEQQIQMNENEKQFLHFIFDDVSALKEKSYNVEAKAVP